MKSEGDMTIKMEWARAIRLVFSDFDGTLTKGAAVIVDQDGREAVICSRRDSLGIEMLKRADIGFRVISKEKNQVVAERCKKMGVPYDQGVADGEGKREIMMRVIKENGLAFNQVAYIGDDVNDLKPMRALRDAGGFAIAVGDAHKLVKDAANCVTVRKGGDGAVREICEIILTSQGHKIEI